MTTTFTIETLSSVVTGIDAAALSALLRDAVEGGASVGFMLPVSDTELATYWSGVLADVAAGKRVLLVTRDGGRIIGSVQLELAGKPNARHRCELQKLLVLRSHRGRGHGSALMDAAETTARQRQRSLVVLDTSANGNALGLYQRLGYTRVGVIPRYAADPDGPMIDTVFYYKELR
jgi:ribosomal protein S18 acetylase RimI-like enzyme